MDYSRLVAHLFDSPPSLGPLAGANCQGDAGEGGRRVVIQAAVQAGQLDAVAFRALGCPHLIAASALAAEALRGQPVAALRDYDPLTLSDRLGMPAGKRGRLLILQDALQNCFRDWDTTQPAGHR